MFSTICGFGWHWPGGSDDRLFAKPGDALTDALSMGLPGIFPVEWADVLSAWFAGVQMHGSVTVPTGALIGALGGLCAGRWAAAYAGRLAQGEAAVARTLYGTLWPAIVRGRPGWRDGLCGIGMALWFAGWLGVGAWSGLTPALLGLMLVVLAWVDVHSGLLPDALTLPLMVVGWFQGPAGFAAASSASALTWLVLSAARALYAMLRQRDGFGGGDVKYLAALAAWVGVQGAASTLLLACLFGLSWRGLHAVRWRSRTVQGGWLRPGCAAFPFGPWLTLAALLLIPGHWVTFPAMQLSCPGW